MDRLSGDMDRVGIGDKGRQNGRGDEGRLIGGDRPKVGENARRNGGDMGRLTNAPILLNPAAVGLNAESRDRRLRRSPIGGLGPRCCGCGGGDGDHGGDGGRRGDDERRRLIGRQRGVVPAGDCERSD